MIDMHAHWRPAELTDALRARTNEPRVVRNPDGVEVLKTRMGEEPLSKAFDQVDFHLARMDRQGVSTSALSLLGSFCWIESQALGMLPSESSRDDHRVAPPRREGKRRYTPSRKLLPLCGVNHSARRLYRALGGACFTLAVGINWLDIVRRTTA